MEDFKITSSLTKKEYSNYMLGAFYKMPISIVITILGAVMITVIFLQVCDVIHIFSDIPWVALIFGIGCLFIPLSISRNFTKKSFPGSIRKKEVDYTFSQDGINTKDATSEVFLRWSSIILFKKTNKFLVFNSSSRLAYFVRKDLFTQEQIDFIQSKILIT